MTTTTGGPASRLVNETTNAVADIIDGAPGGIDLGGARLDPDTGELFDPAPYITPVPALDGHRADTLKLAFAGGVEIDLMVDDDLEWFKSLRFGQELELRVTATVAKVAWTHKANSEGEEKVAHTLGLAVHSYELDA